MSIELSGGQIVFGIIILVIIAMNIFFSITSGKDIQKELKKKIEELENRNKYNVEALQSSKLNEKEILLTQANKESGIKELYQKWALEELAKYKVTELETQKKIIETQAFQAASLLLKEWKEETEKEIRGNAIMRSQSVTTGKVLEHLIPYGIDFLAKFNPKDVRFIGSPIDLIIFKGHAESQEDITVYFAEVKTGNSKLTIHEKRIKRAIENKNVRWIELPNDIESEKIFDNENKQITSQIKEELEQELHQGKLQGELQFTIAQTENEDVDAITEFANTLLDDGLSLTVLIEKLNSHPAYKRLEKSNNPNVHEFLLKIKTILESNEEQEEEIVEVDSTAIQKLKYNHQENYLDIEFKSGNINRYLKVPQNIFIDFKNANSKGSFAYNNIYNTFKFQKIR